MYAYDFSRSIDYVEGTFDLVWRQQNTSTTLEEEVQLHQNSTATLLEVGMEAEPKKSYLLIKDTESGMQPEKVNQVRNDYRG